MNPLSIVFTLAICIACASGDVVSVAARVSPAGFERSAVLDAGVPKVLRQRHVAGAGIAILRHGRIAWTGYYGEQGPGVPVSRNTMFNTASLAKSITAETVLRLVAQDKVSLDEPIADHYVHPDLAGDPRYRQLTPRLILSHRSGLRNWEYEYKDKKLAFVADPGTRFGYSGAAYDILAMFLEKKLHADFETLVQATVFDPIGMTGVSMRRRAAIDARVTTPMDADGAYGKPYTTAEHDWHHGKWSAASDLFVTVEDYAKFLASVMADDGLTPALAAERLRPVASFAGAAEWECRAAPSVTCPQRYGFGLGWIVFDYGNTTTVWGGGNDSGENAMVVFSPDTPGDAIIVFVNGGNGVNATLDIIDLIDAGRGQLVPYIRELIARHEQAK
ncbi:CubicO group peptidase (beta-lactamase class C family) [Dokdonella fugitiva]|uniref:CubicO group peptidase (Beta-lactamase class C family) n=1 Tax=Dokdonella fugitiva TaxID=328517 RepID=A0A839F385_9GAMM|nr:serine hydrolase domain-containing protein [Dokdonella fugitiva]MBA8888299.1 CubicO group peptidase (beta-lactamase class C family) [Dokdonella fugitiva]